MKKRKRSVVLVAAFALAASACEKDKTAERESKTELAPVASALASAEPKAPAARAFRVDSASSSFKFLMDSPLEKIEGDAPRSVEGELFVDPSDLTKATALVKADLQKLTLYQQKRADEKTEYGERSKSDLQNEHARDWLQITAKSGEVTPEQAEMNRWAAYKVDRLENLSASDVTKLSGAERKVTATAVGDFRLHGRKAPKSVKLELVFDYSGEELKSIAVKTLEPLSITLEEFEVHPRDAAGKFVKSVTDALASNLKGKVAKDAPVMVSFVAQPK
jgi:polyisoprenoid-binding protein YceI